jgi:hypothetical protein
MTTRTCAPTHRARRLRRARGTPLTAFALGACVCGGHVQGILQLDEFYAMIRERKPDMTDAEAFKVYDEALALSEQMLGYETDAILADAFTKTAMGHNLFAEIAQPLRAADHAADEPPPRWAGLDRTQIGASALARGGARRGSTLIRRGSGSGGMPMSSGEGKILSTLGGKRGSVVGGARTSVVGSTSMPALPPAAGAVGAAIGNKMANALLRG